MCWHIIVKHILGLNSSYMFFLVFFGCSWLGLHPGLNHSISINDPPCLLTGVPQPQHLLAVAIWRKKKFACGFTSHGLFVSLHPCRRAATVPITMNFMPIEQLCSLFLAELTLQSMTILHVLWFLRAKCQSFKLKRSVGCQLWNARLCRSFG